MIYSPQVKSKFFVYRPRQNMLGTKRNCLPFLRFISAASENHVTVCQVTILETSFTLLIKKVLLIGRLLHPLRYVRSTCIQITLRELPAHQTYINITSAILYHVLGATIALLFKMVWENYYCDPYM